MIAKGAAAPRLIYLVSEDWYFLSHRLPMAQAAQRAGYDVHVATAVGDGAAAIESLGFALHPLRWRRGSMNPLDFLSIVRQVRRLYRRLRPDLVHHVALEPVVIGSLAATGLPMQRLNALAGLGFAFTSTSGKARIARALLTRLLRLALGHPHSAVLVQNPDDRANVAALGAPAERIFLIPGSGVDADLLQPLPEPAGPITAAFVGRLLDDKGVRTLVAAHALLAERGTPVRVLLAGDADPANPASIPQAEIGSWHGRPGLVPLGHVPDIREVWAAAHMAVLPSRREGLPKSLLEAAACGRPIVASDVVGCREIARPGVNALLVPADDPVALAEAMAVLAADADLRAKFGQAGRELVTADFSARQIGAKTVELYDRLLGRKE